MSDVNISINKEAVVPVVREVIGDALQRIASKTIESENPAMSIDNLNVIAQAFGFVICSKCGAIGKDEYNFCSKCTAKLHEVCPQCWQKEGQPNSCPDEKCPTRDTVIDINCMEFTKQFVKVIYEITNKDGKEIGDALKCPEEHSITVNAGEFIKGIKEYCEKYL